MREGGRRDVKRGSREAQKEGTRGRKNHHYNPPKHKSIVAGLEESIAIFCDG